MNTGNCHCCTKKSGKIKKGASRRGKKKGTALVLKGYKEKTGRITFE